MGQAMITEQSVSALEQSLDKANALLTPLKEFILPGGGLAASHCHVARACVAVLNEHWSLWIKRNH